MRPLEPLRAGSSADAVARVRPDEGPDDRTPRGWDFQGGAFIDQDDLAAQLTDRARLRSIRDRAWATREGFTFDAHADALAGFLRHVIDLPRRDIAGVAA